MSMTALFNVRQRQRWRYLRHQGRRAYGLRESTAARLRDYPAVCDHFSVLGTNSFHARRPADETISGEPSH
jgi:hypothetical protein